MYFNQVSIVVTLGKNADVRSVGERSLVTFTGASSKTYSGANGNPKENTSWINFKYWCKSDKIASYLVKGATVLVSGEIATDVWEKDGSKHSSTFVNVTNILFMPKREGRVSEDAVPSHDSSTSSNDVPF